MPKETTVYVGRKPPTNYVLAVVTGFNVSNAEQVVLKAREERYQPPSTWQRSPDINSLKT